MKTGSKGSCPADLLRVHHRAVAAETKRERYFRRRVAIIAEAPPTLVAGEGAKIRQAD